LAEGRILVGRIGLHRVLVQRFLRVVKKKKREDGA
jgi:hypothetical protein